MVSPVVYEGAPAPFPKPTRIISFDDLLAGWSSGPVEHTVTQEAVDEHLAVVNGNGGSFPGIPLMLVNSVGLIKLSLGGAWPDETVHVAQEVHALGPLRLGDRMTNRTDVETVRRTTSGRRLVRLTTTVSHLDEAPAVVSLGTFLWASPSKDDSTLGSDQTTRLEGRNSTGGASNQLQITAELLAAYGRLAGATAKIHTDPEYAAESEFGSLVAQGMLLASFAEVNARKIAGLDGLRAFNVRFISPAVPGDTVNFEDVGAEAQKRRNFVLQTGERMLCDGAWTGG